jgi:hypothetical protein
MGLKSGTALALVELTFFGGGSTLTTKGFIQSYSLSHAVNTEAKLEFSAVCQPADWQ